MTDSGIKAKKAGKLYLSGKEENSFTILQNSYLLNDSLIKKKTS
jgi:hypothetical protein